MLKRNRKAVNVCWLDNGYTLHGVLRVRCVKTEF